jgi:predicted nucleic acid-binding protein
MGHLSLGSLTELKPGLVSWARQQPSEELFISVITVWELEVGIFRKEAKTPAQGSVLHWLDRKIPNSGRILSEAAHENAQRHRTTVTVGR